MERWEFRMPERTYVQKCEQNTTKTPFISRGRVTFYANQHPFTLNVGIGKLLEEIILSSNFFQNNLRTAVLLERSSHKQIPKMTGYLLGLTRHFTVCRRQVCMRNYTRIWRCGPLCRNYLWMACMQRKIVTPSALLKGVQIVSEQLLEMAVQWSTR